MAIKTLNGGIIQNMHKYGDKSAKYEIINVGMVDCPRESVSWYDCMAFCLWLSEMTVKCRVPTEQQWQRGSNCAMQNERFLLGNKIE